MKLSAVSLGCMAAVLLALGAGVARAAGSDVEAGLSAWQVGYEIYQVGRGDTVENIAARYGVTAESIRNINNLGESGELAPGESLAIVLPGRPRLPDPRAGQGEEQAPAEGGAPETDTVPFAPRYASTTKACTIVSACPPARGSVLYQLEAGTKVIAKGEQRGHLAVVMVDGSTGWLPVSAARLTGDAVTQDELDRMLQAGADQSGVVKEALRYLGTPYRYGGRLPRDVDCSLLVQAVFATRGVHLPRTAAEQCDVGRSVSMAELQPGDRLYFISRSGRIAHTALYIGNGQFLHASSTRGCVAIDSLHDPRYLAMLYAARR